MKFRELMEDETARKEIDEAIKAASPKNDKEYFAVLTDEVGKRGAEVNENELRAYIVSKMPVDEDELEKVSGGTACVMGAHDVVCLLDYSCFTALMHADDSCNTDFACWDTYGCFMSAK